MAVYNRYVDFTSGNDSTGDGTTSAPWLTLVKAAATPPGALTSGDTLNIIVRNGDGGTATANRPVFNNLLYDGVHITIDKEDGEPDWVASAPVGASEYIVRFFLATSVPASFTVSNADWTMDTNQVGVQGLGNPTGMDMDISVSNVTCSWDSWNIANVLVACASSANAGDVTITSCTTTGMAKPVLFAGMSGTLTMTGNTFGLGAGTGTWRVLDYGGAAVKVAPNIISSGNTWTSNTADGMTFLGSFNPLVTVSDKLWSFVGDTFDFDGASSAAKFLNVDDCDASSTHRLRFRFKSTTLSMNSTGTVVSIGRNVGAYTNSQKPRLKTLLDDCTQLFAKFDLLDSTWTNINSGASATLCAIKVGVIQTNVRRSTLTCPNSAGHSMNFIANDVTLDDCYLEGELPVLAYGDRLTMQDCYSKGTRPFVAGKTGGGDDESTQGHTILDNVFVCTGTSADDSAFDTYGWQADDPYGSTWYSSTDTDGSEVGLKGWTVKRNTFVAISSTASAVGLGRPSGAGSHELGRFNTAAGMEAFLLDGNGGEGRWIDVSSEFADNVLVQGAEPDRGLRVESKATVSIQSCDELGRRRVSVSNDPSWQ